MHLYKFQLQGMELRIFANCQEHEKGNLAIGVHPYQNADLHGLTLRYTHSGT